LATRLALACAGTPQHAVTSAAQVVVAPRQIDARAVLAAKIGPICSALAEKPSPGCAVGVYRAGEIVSKGYGYADIEHDAMITDTTLFYSASLSKQFKAAAVMPLVAVLNIERSERARSTWLYPHTPRRVDWLRID